MLKLIGGLAALVLAFPTLAQETVRVRGEVERLDGPLFVVKTREGASVTLAVTDKPLFVAIVKASIVDIKPGMYVGSGAMPQPDGSQRAIEVHIFPETMRGTGEGHRPWDYQPQATMTNANVDAAVAGVDGHEITLKYKGGEKKLIVTPTTPVVRYDTGSREEIKPGTKITVTATRQADGTLLTPRISYGRDGLTPPM
jgi:hypothetical protein